MFSIITLFRAYFGAENFVNGNSDILSDLG